MLESLMPIYCDGARDWVETSLVMPLETSPNAPGALSLERQPWMEEILEAILDPSIDRMTLCMGSQVGKTTLLLLAAALVAQFDPAPLVWAFPSDKIAEQVARTRILPFFQKNPVLAEKLSTADGAVTPKLMQLTSMPLYITGVQSPSKLASVPAAYIFADESAKYAHKDRKEAAPMSLLAERVKSFARHLIIEASTPNTVKHPFYQSFLNSDRRQFFIPCPHCGHMQTLTVNKQTLRFDTPAPGESLEIVRRTAAYHCEQCDGVITDEQKMAAMQCGQWRPVNGKRNVPTNHRGYHLNSLYSPFLTFGEVAVEFYASLQATTSYERLQNFANSWEAKPYTPYAVRVTSSKVRQYISPLYRKGELPANTLYLATAYDPGQEHTHWVTVAFCAGGEMYVIDWGILTAFASTKRAIGPARHFESLRYGEKRVRPAFGYVDSGNWAKTVYQECRRTPNLRPSKGGARGTTGNISTVPLHEENGLLLTYYSDYSAKAHLYGQIISRGLVPFHLPADADNALVDGLSGQTLVQDTQGKYKWKKVAEDHYGDCVKLCMLTWWQYGHLFGKGEPVEVEGEQMVSFSMDDDEEEDV